MSLRSEVIKIFNQVIAGSKKISALPELVAPGDNDFIEIVQDGVNYKIRKSNLVVGGGGGSSIDALSVSTAAATITLNFQSVVERLFYGSTASSGNKTIALSNFSNALRFEFFIDVNANDQLTFPAGFIMSDGNWEVSGSQIWTAPFDGLYHFKATLFDTTWSMEANSTPKI